MARAACWSDHCFLHCFMCKKVDDKGSLDGQISSVVFVVMGYYESTFSKSATYGTSKEPLVRKLYCWTMASQHKHFLFTETGLHVSHEAPCIAAFPDGLVSCACCGLGLFEAKCPWTHRAKTVQELALWNLPILYSLMPTQIISVWRISILKFHALKWLLSVRTRISTFLHWP